MSFLVTIWLKYFCKLFLKFFLLVLFLNFSFSHCCSIKRGACLCSSCKFHSGLTHLRLIVLSWIKRFLSTYRHPWLLYKGLSNKLPNINHTCLCWTFKFSAVNIMRMWRKGSLILMFNGILIFSTKCYLIFNIIKVLIDLISICHWSLISNSWFSSIMNRSRECSHVISAIKVLICLYTLMHFINNLNIIISLYTFYLRHYPCILLHFFFSVVVSIITVFWLFNYCVLLEILGVWSAWRLSIWVMAIWNGWDVIISHLFWSHILKLWATYKRSLHIWMLIKLLLFNFHWRNTLLWLSRILRAILPSCV